MHAILIGRFYATYANVYHYVVFLVPHALLSVTCGLFVPHAPASGLCMPIVSWVLAHSWLTMIFVD